MKDHPTVHGQPDTFDYSADWTNHARSVTGLSGFKVLLRVNEKTYEPVRDHFKTRGGRAMGEDHPIAWLHENGGGRFFYAELGHDVRSLETPFGRHILPRQSNGPQENHKKPNKSVLLGAIEDSNGFDHSSVNLMNFHPAAVLSNHGLVAHTIEAYEPSFFRHSLDPVGFFSGWSFWSKPNGCRTICIRLHI